MPRIVEKAKAYFSNLEDGTPKMLFWMGGTVIAVILVTSLLGVPQLASAMLLPLTIAYLTRTSQQSRPADSLARVAGGLRTESFLANPRFAGPIATGLNNLGKRLWQPKWITGNVDITRDGLRWNLDEGGFGFRTVYLRWSEMTGVSLCPPRLSSYVEMLVEGYGSPLLVRVDVRQKRTILEFLRSARVPVRKGIDVQGSSSYGGVT